MTRVGDPYRVLFVCTGNTCRSPMAEAIFVHEAAARGLAVAASSAGTFASGGEMAPSARRALAEIGIEVGPRRSVPLDERALAERDLVLAMEPDHIERIRMIAPKLRVPLSLLGTYGFPPVDRIADPFGGDFEAYRATRDELLQRVRALLRQVAEKSAAG